MYVLKLKHNFSAAHQLKNAYSKECNDFMHGHNWKVLVKIETEKLSKGMVVDFKKIKEIINKLDHKTLNKVVDFEPTAENLSYYLQGEIEQELFNRLTNGFRVSVTIWEADNASITFKGNKK